MWIHAAKPGKALEAPLTEGPGARLDRRVTARCEARHSRLAAIADNSPNYEFPKLCWRSI